MRDVTLTSSRTDGDQDMQKKVNQVAELTGKSHDEAVIALHDCDFDSTRAINMLLEGDTIQGEWHESKRKKRPVATINKASEEIPSNEQYKSDGREKSREREREKEGPDITDKPIRRARQPPRLARKNKENEDNNKNENSYRERDSFDGRRGRGRGRGYRGSGGRGRGRGGRSRGGFRTNAFGRDNNGPSIGTWSNETAEKDTNNDFQVSMWSESEDWDEWTGSLEESKVFIKSEPETHVLNNGFEEDVSLFSMNNNNQVFSDISLPNGNEPSLESTHNMSTSHSLSGLIQDSLGQNSISQELLMQSHMSQNTLPHRTIAQAHNEIEESMKQNALVQNSLSPLGHNQHTSDSLVQPNTLHQNGNSLNQNSVTQSNMNQPSSLGQRLDLSMLLKSAEVNAVAAEVARQQQSQFLHQCKQAAEQAIKNAVGLCTSPSLPVTTVSYSQSHSQMSTSPVVSACNHAHLANLQRNKISRAKLPPPSKIPESAVEMPGQPGSLQLDVRFGNWDLPISNSAGVAAISTSDSSLFSYSSPSKDMHITSLTSHANAPQMTYASNQSNFTESTASYDTTLCSTLSSSSTLDSSNPLSVSVSGSSITSSVPSPTAVIEQTSISPQADVSLSSRQIYSADVNKNTVKDYVSQALNKNNKISGESIFSSQADLKSSQYAQRASVTSLNKSGVSSGSYSYNQTGYPSSYNNAYQGTKTAVTTVSYTQHASGNMQQSNLSSHISGVTSSNNLPHNSAHSAYISNFSSQGAFNNSQNGNSLYQSAQSAFQSPNANSYHIQSFLSRDTQSSNGYSNTNQNNSYIVSNNSQSFQRDSHSAPSGFGSLQTTSIGLTSSKLSESLSKMSVKDSGLENISSQFESVISTPSAVTSTSNLPSHISSVNSLPITCVNSSQSSLNSSKSLPSSTKAPPNLPQGIPPIVGHNYLIGQHGMPLAFASLAAQQPMYSYEDMQLLSQRMPFHYMNYDLSYQQPSLSSGRDHSLSSMSCNADGKLSRLDAQSPVAQVVSTPNTQTVQSPAAPQQAFINPGLAHGYNHYYYPGGLATYSYPATVFPVPPVTQSTHGTTTVTSQFQKAGIYAASHAYGYDELSSHLSSQDYSKAYGAVPAQGISKATVSTVGANNTTDLSSSYGKSHSQAYDKAAFAAGTPPPFNLLPSGVQGGPNAGAAAAYGAPYMPVMTAPHSQMLHQLQQESSGVSTRATQQNSSQNKSTAKNYAGAYWGNS